MTEDGALGLVKVGIKAWLTVRDRLITAGHELVEAWQDLVEEARHEHAEATARPRVTPTEGGVAATTAPTRQPAASRPSGAGSSTTPRRTGRGGGQAAGAAPTRKASRTTRPEAPSVASGGTARRRSRPASPGQAAAAAPEPQAPAATPPASPPAAPSAPPPAAPSAPPPAAPSTPPPVAPSAPPPGDVAPSGEPNP